MDKPKPKKELVIVARYENVQPCDQTVLIIVVTSRDAKVWLEENAPDYGSLLFGRSGRYRLMVDPQVFDPDEVAEYIGRMGE